MTEKKITYALSRIKAAKENKYPLEALLRAYHLNVELLKFIISKASPKYVFETKKMKGIVKEFHQQSLTNTSLKSIINKSSIKSLKPWLIKMDSFFKALKLNQPANLPLLQTENEKIFGILKISANKLFVKK